MAVTPAARPAGYALAAGVLACGLWALVVLGLVATAWLEHLLGRAGRPDLAHRGVQLVPTVLAALSAATVGAVVASRRPSHPVGWLLLGLLLTRAGRYRPRRGAGTGGPEPSAPRQWPSW